MYHYVRDLKESRFKDIKGLDISLFYEQVEYLKKHYNLISMEMLIEAIENNVNLPQKAALLTFDDAYSDHFKYVFPFLDKMKIKGAFYPPFKAIAEHKVLDVNKIHFILASESNKDLIINEIKKQLKLHKDKYNLSEFEVYFNKLAKSNRFDDAKTIFIKRLLQVELEEKVRTLITDNLFTQFLKIDETAFSQELYMDIEQLKCMSRNGMHIGSHGYDHYWLASLSEENQEIEIKKSIHFLNDIGISNNNWTMCYPYGSYNDTTIKILNKLGCKLALTTEVSIAKPNKTNRFAIPRLDTNDIPKDRKAEVNDWFIKA